MRANQLDDSRVAALALLALLTAVACPAALASAEGFPMLTPTSDRPLDKVRLEQLARRVEPDLAGRPERLSQYVDAFRVALANDARLYAFDVKVEAGPDASVALRGHVEYPESRRAIASFLGVLGFSHVDNQVEVLPAAALGAHRLGFVVKDHTLSYKSPSREEVVTDCLYGEPLFLLREVDQYLLVHGGDGYLGYVLADDVHRVTEAEFARCVTGPVAWLTADYAANDGHKFPAGSRFKWIADEGDSVAAETAEGERVLIPADRCTVRKPPVERIDAVVAAAKRLLGARYLWGGKTSAGVDCSGLVQTSFARAGVRVPRDANQQFHVGQLTALRWCTVAMRRGDTLYFIDPLGRVSHTGIYLGDGQFIHSCSPVVTIGSFNPDDPIYDANRHASFAFARRLWD